MPDRRLWFNFLVSLSCLECRPRSWPSWTCSTAGESTVSPSTGRLPTSRESLTKWSIRVINQTSITCLISRPSSRRLCCSLGRSCRISFFRSGIITGKVRDSGRGISGTPSSERRRVRRYRQEGILQSDQPSESCLPARHWAGFHSIPEENCCPDLPGKFPCGASARERALDFRGGGGV